MTVFDFIDEKRRGGTHTAADIEEFIKGVTDGEIPDYQITAWLMAVCIKGMTPEETAALTDAMERSGEVLSLGLDKVCVDKHSTGGVGDKVTLFAAPVCAACGVYVPKMSGSGLGATGGTIDKLSAIPGFSTELSYDEFISAVKEVGFAVAGHSGALVPADKKLYELRSAVAAVESIPLICSSIMSKKLATGADALLLDVKVGSGAFMKTEESAEELARLMLKTAAAGGIKAAAMLTDMSKPLGRTAGNGIEVIEAIEALKGNFDEDLKEVAMAAAAEMLVLAGVGGINECYKMAEDAVTSGKALEKFRQMIIRQGGDPDVIDDYGLFPKAAFSGKVFAEESGYIENICCDAAGKAAFVSGAGRENKETPADPGAGIRFAVSVGDHAEKGDVLAEVYASSRKQLDEAVRILQGGFAFCDNRVKKRKNIIKIIRGD